MKMTEQEMRLAVCEKLPELFENGLHKSGSTIDWNWEGLQVCHEAESTMSEAKWLRYLDLLNKLAGNSPWIRAKDIASTHATYEQRLEALCRVWWPERFK